VQQGEAYIASSTLPTIEEEKLSLILKAMSTITPIMYTLYETKLEKLVLNNYETAFDGFFCW
jgi:hypothetical protein